MGLTRAQKSPMHWCMGSKRAARWGIGEPNNVRLPSGSLGDSGNVQPESLKRGLDVLLSGDDFGGQFRTLLVV